MTENKKSGSTLTELIPLAIGEAAVVGLVIGGFAIADAAGVYATDYLRVSLGAALGGLIILANHLWLCLTVDREVKKYMDIRGSREMSEEESLGFSRQHSARIKKAMALSSFVRTGLMFGLLILAFITGWFNPLATAIPMFTLRPILQVSELIKSKNNPRPDPGKFIKYEDEAENNDEDKEDS